MLNGVPARAALERVRTEFLLQGRSLRFSSPLFAALATQSAQDDAILELATRAPPATRPVAMFVMLATQFLLMRNRAAPLAEYFPSLTNDPRPAERAFPAFRAFCVAHRQELLEILTTRTLNMNLVERSATVLPALAYLAAQNRQPATLIELGCSAGFTLLFDRYFYDFGAAGRLGPANSSVRLECTLLGEPPVPLNEMPVYPRRIGIDLMRVDATVEEDRLWMEAMLPPEWNDERRALRAALDIRASSDLEVHIADAQSALPALLATVEGPVVVLATHVMHQLGAENVARLDSILREASRHRLVDLLDVDAASLEPSSGARERLLALTRAGIPLNRKSMPSRLRHTRYRATDSSERDLAEVDGLGRWIRFSTGAPSRTGEAGR